MKFDSEVVEGMATENVAIDALERNGESCPQNIHLKEKAWSRSFLSTHLEFSPYKDQQGMSSVKSLIQMSSELQLTMYV